MNIENIKTVLNTDAGGELLEYLADEIDKLNRLEGLDISWNPIKTTINLKANKKAYERLTQIINPLVNWSRQIEPKDERDSYKV